MPYQTHRVQRLVQEVQGPHLLMMFHMLGWNTLLHLLLCAVAQSCKKLCLFAHHDTFLIEELSFECATIYGVDHPLKRLRQEERLIFINSGEDNEQIKIQRAIEQKCLFVMMADSLQAQQRQDCPAYPVLAHRVRFHSSLVEILSYHGATMQTCFHHWQQDGALSVSLSSQYHVEHSSTIQLDMSPLFDALFKPCSQSLTRYIDQWANLAKCHAVDTKQPLILGEQIKTQPLT